MWCAFIYLLCEWMIYNSNKTKATNKQTKGDKRGVGWSGVECQENIVPFHPFHFRIRNSLILLIPLLAFSQSRSLAFLVPPELRSKSKSPVAFSAHHAGEVSKIERKLKGERDSATFLVSSRKK